MIKQIHVNECDSTQDLIKEQLKGHSGPEGLVVSCNYQGLGRGRGQNPWTSMPGTICFSMTLKPHQEMSFTALELSLLVVKFFEGSKLTLKWPNDIWNGQQKKCCGILIQNSQNTMIAGIGLNLWSSDPDFGGVYDSSFEFDKKSWSHELATFIHENRYASTEALKKDWETKCGHMGEHVRITEGEEWAEGIFMGLGSHGEALLMAAGEKKHFYNGSLRILSTIR